MMAPLYTTTLAEIADLNPALGEALRDDEPVTFIPMSAVDAEMATTDSSTVRPYSEVSKGYTPFVDGDVLVAKITPCFENGKIAQARLGRRVGFGSTEFHVVRPHPNRADARYLLHFLRQERVRLEGERKMTGSAGQRRVPEHFLAGLRIPLPPLTEQRRIAQLLDNADALRAKRRSVRDRLNTLSQSVFIDMFGDPDTNPKGWSKTVLGELISVGPQNGLYKPASDYGTGTPILRIDAFYDGMITDLATLKRVRLSDEEQALYGLHPDEIVINRVNSREYLGKSALIPALSEPTVFESNMMRFGVHGDSVRPTFLIHYLQTGFVRSRILQSAKDAINQSSINQQDVKALPVLVPPMAVQVLFAQRLASTARLDALNRDSLTELDSLFASLQDRAFAGEL